MVYLILLLTLGACTNLEWSTKASYKPNQEKIFEIVKNSSCSKYSWKSRGVAPIGYLNQMALLYAKHYCSPNSTTEVFKKDFGAANKDALVWYGLKEDRLRDLFTLAIGHGMRESSGKYCCGKDQSATNSSSDTAEAGTFQTSWNAHTVSPEMDLLFKKYLADKTDCLFEVAKVGVPESYCKGANAKNYGSGDGLKYQELSKGCPAFHAEFSLIMLRLGMRHYGPIISKAAEVNASCNQMLKQIEAIACTK